MPREMKDSGVEWIGSIPANWELRRTKKLFSTHKDIVGNDVDKYERLALTLKGVIRRSKEDSVGLQPDAFNGYQILRKGELVFKLIDLENVSTSRVGISPYEGIVSPAYIILTPNDCIYAPFGEYYFLSMWQREVFNHIGDDGVRSSLNSKDLLNIPFVRPDTKEQQQIVNYLGEKCDEIDSIVVRTRATIEEYKKLKQSVVSEVVTAGVRGSRTMRNSDIAWIGSVPTDWCCTKLKYLATLRSGITLGKKYPYDVELVEVPYLRVANVQGSYVDLDDVTTLSVMPEEVEKYRLHAGEVLMTEGGDRDKLGRGCVWNGELDPCLHQNHVFAVQTNEEKLLGQFLAYITASTVARTYFDVTAKKTTNLACTNSTTILDFTIPIPPIEEQREIVEYLNAKCAEIDALISKKEQLLDELGNFKKSLIYEYVTGKKEVPCASEPVITCIFPAVVPCKSAKFAQAILMSRIIDDFTGAPFGRVKLEKTMHVVENLVGFDFETLYIREAAGPLDHDLYKCEGIISKKNKWFTIHSSRYGVSYRPTSIASKYKLYYQKYFSNYDAEITRIIQLFRGYTTDQAEMVATLFASWNDFIIGGKSFTDEDIVDDVLNNWNESKKRFPADSWHRALDEMRKNNIVPHGYGRRTVHQTDVQGS